MARFYTRLPPKPADRILRAENCRAEEVSTITQASYTWSPSKPMQEAPTRCGTDSLSAWQVSRVGTTSLTIRHLNPAHTAILQVVPLCRGRGGPEAPPFSLLGGLSDADKDVPG